MFIQTFLKMSPNQDKCGLCNSPAKGQILTVYGHTERYMKCLNEKCSQSSNHCAWLDPNFKEHK